MKAFKSTSAAIRAADGKPFITIERAGKRLSVVIDGDDLDRALTMITVMTPTDRGYTHGGRVTLRHLDRLGNANDAVPRDRGKRPRAFPEDNL